MTPDTATRSVVLRIYGIPMPQGSKTAFVRGNRAVLTDGRRPAARAAHAAWRQAVATAARDHLTAQPWTAAFDTACVVHATFLLPRPKSIPKKRRYPDRRPDLDKLTRSLLDGLADGALLADDSRVVELNVIKRYVDDEAPGALVTVHVAGGGQ